MMISFLEINKNKTRLSKKKYYNYNYLSPDMNGFHIVNLLGFHNFIVFPNIDLSDLYQYNAL